jgi:hypothetical protein
MKIKKPRDVGNHQKTTRILIQETQTFLTISNCIKDFVRLSLVNHAYIPAVKEKEFEIIDRWIIDCLSKFTACGGLLTIYCGLSPVIMKKSAELAFVDSEHVLIHDLLFVVNRLGDSGKKIDSKMHFLESLYAVWDSINTDEKTKALLADIHRKLLNAITDMSRVDLFTVGKTLGMTDSEMLEMMAIGRKAAEERYMQADLQFVGFE